MITKLKSRHTPVFADIPSLNKTQPIIPKTTIPTAKPRIRLGYISPSNANMKLWTLFMNDQLIGSPKNISAQPNFIFHPHLIPACNWINDKTCPIIPYKTP